MIISAFLSIKDEITFSKNATNNNSTSRRAEPLLGLTLPILALLALLVLTPPAARAEDALTLEQAISTVLAQNPETIIAQQRIAAAQAGIRQAGSAFWPQVQLSSSYTRTDNAMNAFGFILSQRAFEQTMDFNHPGDTDDWNARAGVMLPLYNGGQDLAGKRAAEAGAEAAEHGDVAVRNALAYETSRAFFSIIKAREFVEAAASNVKALEANYQLAQKRASAGTFLETDLLDVQVQLAKAREDHAHALNAASLAAQALGNLMGAEGKEAVIDPRVKELQIPDKESFEKHPELLAVKAQVKAAEEAVHKAKGGYLPKVNGFANVDRDTGWETNESGNSWTAGVMVSVNLWDGQLTSGRVAEAEAQLISAKEAERKVRLRLDFELQQAKNNLQDANQRLAVSSQAVSQATRSAELTRARYEQGLATVTQLIDSQNALTMAKVRRSEAEADRRIAVAAMRKAAGLTQY